MRAFVLVAIVALLAGCAYAPGLSARRTVTFTVTDEPEGPPVAGVSVRARLGGPIWSFSDDAVTDANGQARMRLPEGASLFLDASGFSPGVYTDIVPTGPALEFALYRSVLVVDMNGTLAGANGNVPGTGTRNGWDAQPVPFGSNAAARAGYAERILLLNATLTWNNTLLTGGGDLALGLGGTPDTPDVWEDSDETQTLPGNFRETISLVAADFDNAGLRDARALYAGAGPGLGYATANGLPYTLHLEAHFGAPRESPGQVTGAILALAAAALLIRRNP